MAEKNKKNLEFIEEVTTNVDEVQKRIFHEILTRNANVEYLQRLNLNGHTIRETFKEFVPVITYEDIQPDINRIANGDTSPILCSLLVFEFISSTGTSGGENKLIPTTEEEHGRRPPLYGVVMFVVSQFFLDLEKGKGMYFLFIKSEAKTPGGLLARTLLTSAYKSSHFRSSLSRLSPYTSPIEAILCLDSYDSITINNKITDPKVIEVVMKILKPDSELADFIEAECSKDSWQWIITRLWPNTKYVDVVVTGAMSQYIPMLDYYCNSLPLISTMYASSECFFGINLNPLFAFGYKNNAPQFNFIRRENVILSIDFDKTNEFDLQNVVNNVANNLMSFDAHVVDYTSYANIATIPGHYVLFWELSANASTPIPPSVLEDYCLTIEESLDSVYRQGRTSDKSIGPLEIRIVEIGTFDKLMDY
ncbi:hypothetical protein H5410_049576 [Solanum commersonii]|uniref:GH3 C-terminal domain-containing protein n=1 Tax=Solanum commersonii TaxID=4109 RepID=A0A9J5WUL2_SOLCO|nr:hypothetical protein H5410_049576 [Solanum commersonii]